MIQCMKTILSYHEKKTDRILSDFHYLLCMPLIIAFSELRYMYSSPSELIGMYQTMVEIVNIYDPLVHKSSE